MVVRSQVGYIGDPWQEQGSRSGAACKVEMAMQGREFAFLQSDFDELQFPKPLVTVRPISRYAMVYTLSFFRLFSLSLP